jgi:integrase/recombinase XerD
MASVNDILFGFKEHLKVLNRSPATVELYSEQAKCFLDAEACDVKAVTRTKLETWIAGLYDHRTKEGKPYAPGTISVKVRSIKRLFEYLEKANIVFINPAEFIQEPKKIRGIPKNILTPAEARQVLDQPNLGTLKGIRDRAILELFYSTGIRIEELCSLTIYDADLQGGMLRITKGKGKKDRVVPMGKHAVKFLREYIARVRPHFTKKNRTERRLFINNFGKPLSKQMAGISVRDYGKAAKVGKKVTAHIFRHTFASSLIKNGADLNAVQKMLGHAALKTTEIYLRTVGVDLKAAHKKSHPREKEREENTTIKPALERIRPAYVRKPRPCEP